MYWHFKNWKQMGKKYKHQCFLDAVKLIFMKCLSLFCVMVFNICISVSIIKKFESD